MKKLICILFGMLFILSCKKEPTADFSFSSSTSVGELIQFTNLSKYSNTYDWNFGDGSASTLESPSHKYSKPGNYTVVLNVKGDGGSTSITKSLKISGITYSILNNSSFPLYNFVSFYWDGNNIQDMIEHGTLASGGKTEIVITKRLNIDFGFTSQNNTIAYVSVNSFNLTDGIHNDLIITNNTQIYSQSMKSISLNNNTRLKNFEILLDNRTSKGGINTLKYFILKQ